MDKKFEAEKRAFLSSLKAFAESLYTKVSINGEWTIRGFIDVFKQVYSMSADTKIISKLLELHLFPYFLLFAESIDYSIELAKHQNYYPDLTFISNKNPDIKFAVDLKTTFRLPNRPGYCNGFTLGSHGEYFVNRSSTKNIQYPYSAYVAHYCFGIIYSRSASEMIDETKAYTLDELDQMPVVIRDFIFFAEEKWKIASDIGGSGNTANIGSIQNISDILAGNGVFALAGEELFDEYWCNYKSLIIRDESTGNTKRLTSFSDFLAFKGLDQSLNNKKEHRRLEG